MDAPEPRRFAYTRIADMSGNEFGWTVSWAIVRGLVLLSLILAGVGSLVAFIGWGAMDLLHASTH